VDANDMTTQQAGLIPHEEIAVRAYRLWEERGAPIGSPEEDWFRAEQEIRSQVAQTTEVADSASVKALAAFV